MTIAPRWLSRQFRHDHITPPVRISSWLGHHDSRGGAVADNVLAFEPSLPGEEMTGRARQPGLFFLSILLAAVPFVFALIRAIQTGTDFRYLWMAIAAFIGAALVMVIGKARDQTQNVVLQLSAIAFLTSTLVAGLTGRLLGARSITGILVVCVAFGLFSAAGQSLYALSRPREM
jgi:hypothetical protein